MIRKIAWGLVFAGAAFGVYMVLFHLDWLVLGPPVPKAYALESSDKSSTVPDPNRPYYDQWGNEFSWQGDLMKAACPNKPDPITGQDNQYCTCPAANADGVYYLQGYDKNTNVSVCGFSYYHQCPYSDAVSADDPLCYKQHPNQEPAAVKAQDEANQQQSEVFYGK